MPHVIMIRAIHLRAPQRSTMMARHFEQHVTDDAIAESQVGAHPQIREGEVCAVQVRNDLHDEDERQQSPGDS